MLVIKNKKIKKIKNQNKKLSIFISTGLLASASIIASFSQTAYAENLLSIYHKAANRDPIIQQAKATYEAEKQNLPIARAAILPKLILRAGLTHDKVLDFPNNSHSTVNFKKNPLVRSKYFSLNLTQSLFEWDNIQRYLQSDLIVQKAIHDLEIAKQDLLIRVSNAYFDILDAESALEFTSTEKDSIKEMYAQAQERFDVGLIAIADVEEAKARYDVKRADEIQAINKVADKYDVLNAIVGEKIKNIDILTPSFKPSSPKPTAIDQWVKMATRRNHTLISQELACQIMAKNEDIAFAGHLPNAKLSARYTGRDSSRSLILDEISAVKGYINTYGASIDGSWELFASGGTQAKINQAGFNTEAESFKTEQVRRGVISDTRQAYRNILTSLSQVKAYEQAQISGMSALDATKAGYDLGTRASIDVLDRLTDLYDQKSRLATARYTYIKNIIKLKQSSGVLSNEDIAIVNKWLVSRNLNNTMFDKTNRRAKILDEIKVHKSENNKEPDTIQKQLKNVTSQPTQADTPLRTNKKPLEPTKIKNVKDIKTIQGTKNERKDDNKISKTQSSSTELALPDFPDFPNLDEILPEQIKPKVKLPKPLNNKKQPENKITSKKRQESLAELEKRLKQIIEEYKKNNES